MQFDIITIFPKIFESFLQESILKRAQEKGKVSVVVHDLREFTKDKFRQVDDRPFGGGPGMVLMPEPIFDAVKKIKGKKKTKVILTCPSGKKLNQPMVKEFSREKNLIIICGHYEGVDDRVREKIVDESVSIGDYILTGGEIPALVIIDAVTRLIPGVLGKEASLLSESFEENLLEYPQYTRPANFRGMNIPNVLLSGHHKEIELWRKAKAIEKTKTNRPDLIK